MKIYDAFKRILVVTENSDGTLTLTFLSGKPYQQSDKFIEKMGGKEKFLSMTKEIEDLSEYIHSRNRNLVYASREKKTKPKAEMSVNEKNFNELLTGRDNTPLEANERNIRTILSYLGETAISKANKMAETVPKMNVEFKLSCYLYSGGHYFIMEFATPITMADRRISARRFVTDNPRGFAQDCVKLDKYTLKSDTLD